MAGATSLKEYLKKYQSGSDDQAKKKKKKKKKDKNPRPNPAAAGVLVVDEDPVWQKPVIDEEEESADDEVPLVDEDVEVKRLKRLEAIRSRKPYGGISEDGSGWVSISNSDRSPHRQRRSRLDTPPSDGEPNADDAKDGDLSPPRQRRRRRLDTPSPERRPRAKDSDEADEDPPGRSRNRSPDADADLSPPRRRNGSVDDLSPPQRNRNQSAEVDADLSPPRRRTGVVDDPSPPRRNRSRSPKVDVDLSPPRRNRKEPVDDLSPPRRNRNQSPEVGDDLSPPRRSRQQLAEGSRRGVSPSIDFSPPRRRKEPYLSKDEDLSPPRKRKEPSVAKESRRTGLLSAEEIKKENDKKRKEEISRFAAMDPSMSGRGAQPVFRDKEGRRINTEELVRAQEEEKPKEKKLEWGKGLAQKREAETRIKDLELEKDKPFARTRDDPELDKMLKERIRWGDPMAHLVKKNSELVLEDLGTDEKMKESGFIVPQSIPSHSWIKRGIDFPPNRYGIRPGRHWDGVDRSNGYEKELFKRQNEKRATETEAYLWSVSDM